MVNGKFRIWNEHFGRYVQGRDGFMVANIAS